MNETPTDHYLSDRFYLVKSSDTVCLRFSMFPDCFIIWWPKRNGNSTQNSFHFVSFVLYLFQRKLIHSPRVWNNPVQLLTTRTSWRQRAVTWSLNFIMHGAWRLPHIYEFQLLCTIFSILSLVIPQKKLFIVVKARKENGLAQCNVSRTPQR